MTRTRTITIYNCDGSAPRSDDVELSNATIHIVARDRYNTEAAILLAYYRCELCAERDPIAYKFEDPIESERFVFDESELQAIESIDPSLIQRVRIVWQ